MATAAMLVLCLAFQGVNPQMPLEAKRFQEAPTGENGQQAHEKGLLPVARLFFLQTFLLPYFCHCRICTFLSSLDVGHLRLEYLRAKGVHWCIEQPSSSLLPLYGPLEERVIKGSFYL